MMAEQIINMQLQRREGAILSRGISAPPLPGADAATLRDLR